MHAENEGAPKFGPWVRSEVAHPPNGRVCIFRIPAFTETQYMILGMFHEHTKHILDLAYSPTGYTVESVEAWAELQS